ncbi:hypothetical protein EUGRSUZ_F04411 [Eucalyptus grandis]|uniref:Uncharacterized protein n=2 Tax=Eucalyptus grandis TaxID=71139 RepID=A0A059BZA8_EUCGR|nr:hypothetical protein EUGRSUZ_F04411 [Eucalyptus grandis]
MGQKRISSSSLDKLHVTIHLVHLPIILRKSVGLINCSMALLLLLLLLLLILSTIWLQVYSVDSYQPYKSKTKDTN